MTAVDDTKKSLKIVGIFSELSPDVLHRLESRCHWHRFEPGKEIIPFEGSATDVYFLTEGLARVVIQAAVGKEVHYRTVRPGEVFGEFAAIDGEPRSATVEITEPSIVASMTAWDFRNVIHDEPEIAFALLKRLTGECRRLARRVLEFSTFAVRNRVQAELLRLASRDQDPKEQAVISPAPKHVDIASRVSTHREAVTRELNRLVRLGILEREGKDLLITDVPRLKEMVHDATDG